MRQKKKWGYVLLVLTCLPLLTPSALAESREVDGEHGVLHVYGTLTENTCSLDMASAWQSVDMGNTVTAQLQRAGDRARPVSVHLRLKNCQAVTARNRDDRNGSLLWSHNQPAVSVRFTAPGDMNNPELVGVRGASGLGLRVQNAYGQDVRLGSRDKPMLLMPGQDTLTYTITPERTSGPLQAGAWHALVNVGLEYD